MKDNTFTITFKDFNAGFSPTAFVDSLTEVGGKGHASQMKNVDVLDGLLTQGKGLANLTNGVLTEKINHILDSAVTTDVSYAIGDTKFYQITPTAVVDNASFPHSLPHLTEVGRSVAHLRGHVYYFFADDDNLGTIGKYNIENGTFDNTWSILSTDITGAGTSLNGDLYPVATKEDIMLFGNGRYVGVYLENARSLNVQKLDFGENSEVADVAFSGQWYIAVNKGANRTKAQIFLYEAGALSTLLDDEVAVGIQKIGFILPHNGVMWVAYEDESNEGFIIGYITGRTISPLVRYNGTLPNYQQKTFYKNTISFLSSSLVYCAGAIVPEFPFALSQYAKGGGTTAHAIGSPFGVPFVSSETSGAYRIAKFSGYETDAYWKSVSIPLSEGKNKATILEIIVRTKALGANAKATIKIQGDQGTKDGVELEITGTGKTRHYFSNIGLGKLEDIRAVVDFSEGSAVNPVIIRSITINGVISEATS